MIYNITNLINYFICLLIIYWFQSFLDKNYVRQFECSVQENLSQKSLTHSLVENLLEKLKPFRPLTLIKLSFQKPDFFLRGWDQFDISHFLFLHIFQKNSSSVNNSLLYCLKTHLVLVESKKMLTSSVICFSH